MLRHPPSPHWFPSTVHQAANLLLDYRHEFAYICDWGMSRVPGQETKASFSQRTGTVRWNAPELQRDIGRGDPHDSPTPETDVWSFATTVWEALTGQIPYESGDTGVSDVRVSVAISMGTSPAAFSGTVLPSGVPCGVALLLERCWNRNPRLRPSMRMVATELAKTLANLDRTMLRGSATQALPSIPREVKPPCPT